MGFCHLIMSEDEVRFLCSRAQETYDGATQVFQALIPQPSTAMTPVCWVWECVPHITSIPSVTYQFRTLFPVSLNTRTAVWHCCCHAMQGLSTFSCLSELACTPLMPLEACTWRYLLPLRIESNAICIVWSILEVNKCSVWLVRWPVSPCVYAGHWGRASKAKAKKWMWTALLLHNGLLSLKLHHFSRVSADWRKNIRSVSSTKVTWVFKADEPVYKLIMAWNQLHLSTIG